MEAGTVALLFSDIEGSTRLLQQLGPAYADLLVDHHRLLRRAFAAHDGIEHGNEGDSFFVTFADPAQAVAAALDAQLALARHEWPTAGSVRVRMGLHVGVIQPVADVIVGMAVHEAARICSAAHGGQVLASDQLVCLATTAPEAVSWNSLGEHRLKDLPRPMRLHQLTHPQLRQTFAPLRSQGAARSNLPPQPTAFVGRVTEIAHVRELLLDARLLTVTGAGGVGKSRIALRVAAEALSVFPDGAWFVDLAPVSDPAAVVTAFATSLGGQVNTEEELLAWMSQQRMLVLVDNCEHLVAATGDLIGKMLHRCPGVTVLATSREPLGLSAEVVWRVPPLTSADAIELLTLRAQAVNDSFAVTDANRRTVEAVCQRLDAIPLALELAAARLTTLSVEQLEERLDRRFRLLSGGRHGGLERHRTLQATVDWSYDLLSADEQAVLARTGVFVGSFPLDALEAVAEDFDPIDVVLHADQLVRKSLLIVEHREQPRYRLLETVRQYALDRLIGAGKAVEARDAHLRWVTALMRAAARTLWLGGDETRWLARLDAEDGNIRSGIDWALERGAVSEAVSIVFGAACWWISRGQTREGLRLVQQVSAAEPIGVDEALIAITEMSMASGCGRLAPEMVDQVRRTADRLVGTPHEWARVIGLAHTAAWSYPSGDVDGAVLAISLCERFVEESRPFGPGAVGWSLQTLFWTNLDAGRREGARAAADAAVAAAAEAHLSILESRMSFNRARMAVTEADHDVGWEYAERAVRVARSTGETFVVAAATQLMADIALARGDDRLARDLLASIIDAVADSMTQTAVDDVVARVAALSA